MDFSSLTERVTPKRIMPVNRSQSKAKEGLSNMVIKLTLTNKLVQAIISGNQRKLQRLMDRGVYINSKNDYGFGALVAALHIEDATKRGRMFRFLIDNGASYKTRDEQHDRSVLLWACVLKRNNQIDLLLQEFGGDFNLRDKDRDGNTCLHYAVMSGDLPMVQLLTRFHLRFGVSVDVEDSRGFTPYLLARRLGYREIAEHLNCSGLASCNHSDFLFRSPREWSQLGKLERKTAEVARVEKGINFAKIQGIHHRNLRTFENRASSSLPTMIKESKLEDKEIVANEPYCLTHESNESPFQRVVGRPKTEINADTLNSVQLLPTLTNSKIRIPTMPPLNNQIKTVDALSLLEQTSLTKGITAKHFHRSEVDKNKIEEYTHAFGTIGIIMNILAEQKTKSFRKSVKLIKPVASSQDTTKKQQLSTFAALFGGKQSSTRSQSSVIKASKISKGSKQKKM